MLKFLAGLFVGLSVAGAAAKVDYKCDYDLTGFIIQKDGKEVCRDPLVWLEFRGPGSYIVCP